LVFSTKKNTRFKAKTIKFNIILFHIINVDNGENLLWYQFSFQNPLKKGVKEKVFLDRLWINFETLLHLFFSSLFFSILSLIFLFNPRTLKLKFSIYKVIFELSFLEFVNL
jgi:hypothetical protein